MLTLETLETELFDEATQRFILVPSTTLVLEHSLVSLSKWEVQWGKPFHNGEAKTTEETHSYIQHMNSAPVPSELVFTLISDADITRISEYINEKHTATWFKVDPLAKPNNEVVTAEVIYYWMIAHQIPMDAEYWHLNKLFTLIKVCNEKNKPPKKSKMPTRDFAASRRALNAQRKAEMGTTG